MPLELVIELSQKLLATSIDDFDATTLHKTRIHILDTLGAGLAGSTAPETKILLRTFQNELKKGQVAIWGTNLQTDMQTAALINGVAAHAYELDDSGGCDHSGAVVLPALMAVMAAYPDKGDFATFLKSTILGYEVGRRVQESAGGYETHNGLGWHSTGTCGVFAATTAAAIWMDLDEHQFASALGIAASFSSGNWAFIHDGSQTKKIHAGHAASSGVLAVRLALSGMNGPKKIFDKGYWGNFYDTYCGDQSDPSLLTSDFGKFWRINRCSIKPYATCRGTHSAIDALKFLMSKLKLEANEIAHIHVSMSSFQAGMCGGKKLESRANAQMSLPYALAAELVYNQVFLKELEQDAYTSLAVKEMLQKIDIYIDEAMKDEDEPHLCLTTLDGRKAEKTIEFPLGSMQNPLSDRDVISKFESLSTMAITPKQAQKIIDFILNPSLDDNNANLNDLMQCQ